LVLLLALQVQNPINAFEYQEYEKKIKNNYSLQYAIDKFPRLEFEEVMRAFVASGRPNRLPGSPGHKLAQDYLEKKLKSFNKAGGSFLKTEFLGLTEDKKDITGVNFIWEKKGTLKPDEILYFGAHYDTLIKDLKTKKAILKGEMPGADNNASGVSLALAMIEILNKLYLPKTVKIVFFDLEESNAQGSQAFFKSQEFQNDKNTKKILGFANLFMLGHDSKVTDVDKKLNNMKIYTRLKSQANQGLDEAFANSIINTGKRSYPGVTFTVSEDNNQVSPLGFPDTLRPLWEIDVPAIVVTQNREGDLNPGYMTSNDFIETLNINTYSNVFKFIMSFVLAWNYDVVK
ncbi:MAG: M28 family peptidase, partial [Bdellovibrionales bacterium]|nr:M28 family peptidase [Bdellovibrionales bacterium]